ncbi:hypothetical protein PG991_004589 [Apiospora marii]|uniref:BRCT domain-containing protein n=1 Tax=Apiospora marii TaxID=335849 RepID=A0ABR1S6R7_9PEZI
MEKKKLLYQLDTPYSASSWPEIPTDDQDAILELLCNFLSPLGNFRRHHTPTSKGKRIKKRKRHVTDSTENGSMNPEAPAIRQYVDIGLTTVTRGLQKPSTTSHDTTESFRQYSVIFVARSGQPSGINSHLPQMVAAASGDAPNSKALIDFVQKRVPVIDVAWLREAVSGGYKDTRIKTVETLRELADKILILSKAIAPSKVYRPITDTQEALRSGLLVVCNLYDADDAFLEHTVVLAAAKELRASFASSQHTPRHGNRGGRSGSNNIPRCGPDSGSNGYRSGPGSYTSGPVRDGSRQHVTPASRSGSLASPHDQRGGSSYTHARNAPQPLQTSGLTSYGSSRTPRVSQPAPTTFLNNVQPHREGAHRSGNDPIKTAATAARSNGDAMRTPTHQQSPPSLPHVTGPSSKPHGGLGNSRYAGASTEAPSTVSFPALPGDSSSASTTVTNGNGQTVEGGQLSVAAQGPKHGGLGSSRYANDTNDASKAAFIVLPVSKANGNGDAPVAAVATGTNGTNGLASQGLQASNASQPAQHSDRFILTAANGFGVGPPPHIGTGSNSSSHIRGISNTSDVEMIDLDGHTEEGIKPLRRHGGIGESRWASSDPVSDAKSPGSPTPNNRPYWRTEKTWSLARYRSPASTKAPADGIAQPPSNRMQTIEEQPTRPDSLQSNNSITKHGGLGSSRYA